MNLTECVNHYFEILLMKFYLAERKKNGRKKESISLTSKPFCRLSSLSLWTGKVAWHFVWLDWSHALRQGYPRQTHRSYTWENKCYLQMLFINNGFKKPLLIFNRNQTFTLIARLSWFDRNFLGLWRHLTTLTSTTRPVTRYIFIRAVLWVRGRAGGFCPGVPVHSSSGP